MNRHVESRYNPGMKLILLPFSASDLRRVCLALMVSVFLGGPAAVGFLDAMASSPRIRILFAEEAIEREALDWLRRRDERECSFVDATSFAVMRQLGLDEALAFDGDFSATGFIELRP